MSKKVRIKIKLLSSAGTNHFYTTTKNKLNTTKNLSLKKYDPKINKHVIYHEQKIK